MHIVFRSALRSTIDEKEKEECYLLLQELDDIEPFTACGYFTVDRTTIVSVLSTVLTYFVILFQTIQC